MGKEITNLGYGDEFNIEEGKTYKLPGFTLEYTDDYQDPVPDGFPNEESGLFRGQQVLLRSDTSEKTIKIPQGSGLVSNNVFDFEGKTYTIVHTVREGRMIESILEGRT